MSTSRQSAMTAFPARPSAAKWAVLQPLIPANRPGGRLPKHTRRSILDAIVYVVRQGVTWRALPADFPHWNTAFWYFQEWQKDGTWGRVEDALRKAVQLADGRASATPSAGIVDSQTVKGTEQPGPRGYDGGKKATGVKRHACVDTIGLVWGLAVTPADVPDGKGARAASGNRLTHLWADSAYRGLFVAFCWVLFDLTVEVVRRREGAVGFEVTPRRWVVERTFGWLTRWRRLDRNYEHTLASSKAVVQVALIGIMTRRIAKTNKA